MIERIQKKRPRIAPLSFYVTIIEHVLFIAPLCFSIAACDPSLPVFFTDNNFTLSLFLEKENPFSQGLAIYDSKVFVIESGGNCNVYDFNSRQFITSFRLGSASAYNHCNCANWGIETPADSSFPLLYVTNGLSGSPSEWHCQVESIQYDGCVFSSKCVQTICLDTSQFTLFNLLVPWGCPEWLIDRENEYLWVWSANIRTLPSTTGLYENNLYHATKFRIPSLSEGDSIVLTASDVLEQVPFEFDAYSTQGGCMYDGRIIYSYGFGNSSSPSKIRVYDTNSKSIINRIDLEGVLDVELEDVAVYENRIFINTNTHALYEIELKGVFQN